MAFQFRRDTAANWTSVNPTLASGELGFETDTLKFKLGSGAAWASTGYAKTEASAINGIVKSNGTTVAAVTIGSGLSWDGTSLSVTGGSGGALSSSLPIMDSVAASGVSTSSARGDHVHPSDTSRAASGQTFYIGSTQVAINRGSAPLALAGIISIDGYASSATTLQNARTINGVSFNGSANINIEGRIGTPIASASTTTIGTAGLGETIHITGTTTISSFGTSVTGTSRDIIFDDSLSLTYNATSMILPTRSNITTAAGDSAYFVCENGASGYWRCVGYTKANGAALASSGSMTYPASGIPYSTGSAWGTSFGLTGTTTVLVSQTSPTLVTPNLGIPSAGTLTNCTMPKTITSSGLTSSTNNILIGRKSSGSGALEEITLGSGLSFSGSTLNVAVGGIPQLAFGADAAAATATEYQGVALGANSTSHGNYSIAIGPNSNSGANSDMSFCVAVGGSALACHGYATAIGPSAQAYWDNTLALGAGACASETTSIAIGLSSYAGAYSSVAIGRQSLARDIGTYFANGNSRIQKAIYSFWNYTDSTDQVTLYNVDGSGLYIQSYTTIHYEGFILVTNYGNDISHKKFTIRGTIRKDNNGNITLTNDDCWEDENPDGYGWSVDYGINGDYFEIYVYGDGDNGLYWGCILETVELYTDN